MKGQDKLQNLKAYLESLPEEERKELLLQLAKEEGLKVSLPKSEREEKYVKVLKEMGTPQEEIEEIARAISKLRAKVGAHYQVIVLLREWEKLEKYKQKKE